MVQVNLTLDSDILKGLFTAEGRDSLLNKLSKKVLASPVGICLELLR